MDFMQLKDSFMNHMKKDPRYKMLQEGSTPEKMKLFRSNFNQFVVDRNIYTHGQLWYREEIDDFVISYLDKKIADVAHALLTPEILDSYNQCYKRLHTFIRFLERTDSRLTDRREIEPD
jgi:hypothetical protein